MKKEIRFMKWSPVFMTISAVTFLVSVVIIAFYGFNLGIDFTGGSIVEIQFVNPSVDAKAVRSEIIAVEKSANVVKTQKNTYIITTHTLTKELQDKLELDLKTKIGEFKLIKRETMGSLVSASLKSKAIWATSLAVLFILIYIAFAFRAAGKRVNSWKFSTMAIVALAHDISILCGMFAFLGHFFGVEVDLLFITAVLTLLGFSVHDTIVVFDRMREMILLSDAKANLESIGDKALNQTLTRSIYTSITALIMIAPLLFFSSDIFWFIFALTFGIVVGSYSSIFVAVPLLIWWTNYDESKHKKHSDNKK